MSYRMIVGLGNPGSEYAATRHNVGFRVLEAFALRHGADAWKRERKLQAELASLASADFGKLILLRPTTYMNASGTAVQKASSYFKIPPEQTVVVYDEINLPLGEVKLSLSGGPGGHNGLADLLAFLPPRFARVRIGIGAKPSKEMALADYVLGKLSPDEESIVGASMDRYLESLERLLREGPERAMNHINRKRITDDSNSI